MLDDRHVRVDVIARLPDGLRRWIDIVGLLLLLPLRSSSPRLDYMQAWRRSGLRRTRRPAQPVADQSAFHSPCWCWRRPRCCVSCRPCAAATSAADVPEPAPLTRWTADGRLPVATGVDVAGVLHLPAVGLPHRLGLGRYRGARRHWLELDAGSDQHASRLEQGDVVRPRHPVQPVDNEVLVAIPLFIFMGRCSTSPVWPNA